MFSSGVSSETRTAIYGLTSKARSIEAVYAPEDSEEILRSRFVIGTLNFNEENEIKLVEVNEDDPDKPEIQELISYSHPGEIWSMAPCPYDPSLLFTCYDTHAVPHCALWRMGNIPQGGSIDDIGMGDRYGIGRGYGGDDYDDEDLKEVAQIPIKDRTVPVKSVLWNLHRRESAVILDAKSLRMVSLADGGVKDEESVAPVTCPPGTDFTTGRWAPLQESVVAAASGKSITAWDIRQPSSGQRSAFGIERAHSDTVRDFDFNPNSLYYLASGGDDCKVRVWDTRNLKAPMKTLSGHSHWIWNVKFHPNHDELLVTSGSDFKVILWNLTSLSSRYTNPSTEPLEADDISRSYKEDGVIKIYEEHDDSVYGLAWGASCSSSLWSFASLSYQGRIVVSYVPQEYSDLLNY